MPEALVVGLCVAAMLCVFVGGMYRIDRAHRRELDERWGPR